MDDGISIWPTIALLNFFREFPAIGKPVLYFGILGSFIVFFIMPVRIIWVVFKHLQQRGKVVVNIRSYWVSNVLLLLAPLPLIEFIILIMSGTEGVSGLLIPVVSLVPFILYLLFEIFRFRAYH
jgi:hypothetical protein